MELQQAIAQTSRSPALVLTKAVVRATDNLSITNAVLARILGLSAATITRMRRGEYILDGKAYELAALFVRLYRSLDAIVGGDDGVAAKWVQADNTALKDKPVNLIQKVAGLVNVLQYLDSRRAIS